MSCGYEEVKFNVNFNLFPPSKKCKWDEQTEQWSEWTILWKGADLEIRMLIKVEQLNDNLFLQTYETKSN